MEIVSCVLIVGDEWLSECLCIILMIDSFLQVYTRLVVSGIQFHNSTVFIRSDISDDMWITIDVGKIYRSTVLRR